jgi:poly-beta-1,6-N-acetyl-D-glucosamine synthase
MIIGWINVTRAQNASSEESFVSIIVAARNEEKTISSLIDSLAQQNYPKDKFEIIIVDDHSTDKTSEIISELIHKHPELKIIKTSPAGIGKKKAITQGVEAAQGVIILTTDADCVSSTGWIKGMIESFKEKTQLVIGAVKIKSDQTFFSTLQVMEFSSVLGTGMAMMGWGRAVMCNGASLAFRKRAFEEVQGYEGNFNIPSGDDEFLMRKIDQKYPRGIAVVSQKDCLVETAHLDSLNNFIQQRLRWAGKWKTNDSIFARLLAAFVLLVQISWLILILTAICLNSENLLLLILLKILLEFSFLLLISNYLKQRFSILAFIALQIIYPVYVICIGIASQAGSYTWKGRTA